MHDRSDSQQATAWADDPTAWFIALQRSLRDGDLSLEALALRELARLGVHVALQPRPAPQPSLGARAARRSP